MQLFKIRCSDIHHITAGMLNKPTVKQMERLAELQAKEKRTEKQEIEMNELIAKRDAPPALQQGAKTYCENWLMDKIYERNTYFSSKYTEKGTECEPQGIELIAKMMGYGMISKNEQYFENDYLTGTPDLILSHTVEDDKCPWMYRTFPLFANELPNWDYWEQMQGYMCLTGKRVAAVNYTLIDAPEHLIDKEARSVAYKLGMAEVEMELYDEVYKKMTYADVPDELKFKRFVIQYDEAYIKALYRQVELCREYIASLLNKSTVVAQYDNEVNAIIVSK